MLTAVGDGLRHPFGGHGDDRQVDRLRRPGHDLADRAERRHALQLGLRLGEGPVHRIRTAGVARPQQIAQHRTAHPAGRPAGADDRDRARREQPLHRARLRTLLAAALHREGLRRRFEVEGEMDGAVLEAALLGVAGVPEHLDHLAVRGQHLGREAADAALPGHRRDVFEQGGGHAPALVRVLDQERDLGLVRRRARRASRGIDPVEADGRDELAADRDRETHPVHVVVMGEPVDVLGGQPGVGREEAVVLRLVRDLFVEADQAIRVLGGDRPDARGASVAQHHVCFPVSGVGVVRLGLHGRKRTARSPVAEGVGARQSEDGPQTSAVGPGAGADPRPHMRDWSRQPLRLEGQHHG